MGRRLLRVSPELLVELCKPHDGQARTYTVEGPLPQDATLALRGREHADLLVLLESAEWSGDSFEPLASPTLSIHLQEAPQA